MLLYSGDAATGLYCLPACGSQASVLFATSAQAERAGFRACPDCRPDRVERTFTSQGETLPELVCRAVQLVLHGALDTGTERVLERELAISARHLRRLFSRHVGVTPDQLARSRRVHFARRLLDDTDLPMLDIAYATGFGSVRQFNREMALAFDATPSVLRGRRGDGARMVADGGLEVELNQIPVDESYDWDATLARLAREAIPGVASVVGRTYRRTVAVEGRAGMIEIYPGRRPDAGAEVWAPLRLRLHLPVWHRLVHIVARVNAMVGLEFAGPGAVPWDGFEAAVAAVLRDAQGVDTGRLLPRLVVAYGTRVDGLPAGLHHVFPDATVLADADLTPMGVPAGSAEVVRTLARATRAGRLRLGPGTLHHRIVEQLTDMVTIPEPLAHRIAARSGARTGPPSRGRRPRSGQDMAFQGP